jgi:hypothetical protein
MVPSSVFNAGNSVAVPLVIVRHRGATTLLHRQAGLRAIQRLNLAFSIAAQNNRGSGGFRYSPTIASNFPVNRFQCAEEEIATFFGVSTKTVERRRKVQQFGDVMEQARAKGRVSVRRNVWNLLVSGRLRAMASLTKWLREFRK